ncbi:MAG: di-heme-cytochrome C peroxidase, partial [Pseudobdellovibrionaceae bacterium]
TSFVTKFKKELGVDTYGQRKAGEAIAWVDEEFYNNKKTTTLRETFYKKKHIVAKYLQTLLQITYGMNVVPNELNLRMEFLANSIGINPNLATTPEGFSRTDAFGRIANLVARTKNPIPLTATASVPPMWNIQYKSLFHWNANTNSVVMRNLGQSFGLGAIKTNPNGTGSAAYDTTANLHNLHRLENLLYKIQTPRLEQLTDEINIAKAINGCNIYHKTCVRCHLPKRERVGPQQELVEYKMLPLNHLKTDSVYSENQAKPVEVSVPMKSGLKGKPDPEKPGNIIIEVPFKDALFAFTKGVRGRYYERYNVPMSDQLEWQKASLRGEELFRDTIKGEKGHTGHSAYFNIDEKPTPGYPARHLAGVWATAPYLHNGSVPSIYDLLKPADKRPKLFFVGSREYDDKVLGFRSDIGGFDLPDLDAKAMEFMNYKPGLLTWAFANPPKRPKDITEAKVQYVCHTYPERCFSIDEIGNSNKGHEGPFFGTELNHDQKMELIEFLKILRPEPEYSFNGFSPYKFDGEKCVEVTR